MSLLSVSDQCLRDVCPLSVSAPFLRDVSPRRVSAQCLCCFSDSLHRIAIAHCAELWGLFSDWMMWDAVEEPVDFRLHEYTVSDVLEQGEIADSWLPYLEKSSDVYGQRLN